MTGRSHPRSPDRLLFRLLGHADHQKRLKAITEDEWTGALSIAEQHRLLPLLHARIERGEITTEVPAHHRHRIRLAHRTSAFEALAHRTELFSVTEMLRAEGIESVALKGAWLAWYAYPEAAERPVRDIDLLVKEGDALAAFRFLQSRDFKQLEGSATPPETMISSAKHLPPLTSPTGIEFEIHMHAWEPAEGAAWPMPPLADQRILQRALPAASIDPCLYPNPQHMLMHLVIHAAYSHRFDVGPLVLFDIKYLLENESISMANFWRDAEDGGWLKGACLVMELVQRWLRPGTQIHIPISMDRELIDQCEALLIQDLSNKENTGFVASLSEAKAQEGYSGLAAEMWQRVRGTNRARHPSSDSGSEGFTHWAIRRITGLATSVADKETRDTAARKANIGRWLSPP